ncbi:RNA polymerase sigma factor [Fredinandcohnia sp. QZ13]|uniref:RNA polymerase sigma factor n=1 Tax=Fredinandcohnia sp. QZ13 TaxID=3073144 RepID=UPI0028531CA4|nr:RNA polymerase sigma factor [Fredinandcohnia sp. QZ13]MDR4887406.1 RNA polymerase sigma factor [Fredinandcohnia sp. QZ13]
MLKKLFAKKKPSEDEYRLIYDLFYDRVYHDAYFITRDPYLAQDVVQDTFMKAFRDLDSLRDRSKMGAWLSTIASRTAIDLIRKQKVWNGIPTEDVYLEKDKNNHSNPVEMEVEVKLMLKEVGEVLSEISVEHREILLLKYIHELKEKEIAELLNLKEGTVKSRIFRAKKELRNLLIGKNFTQHRDGEVL